ncbi:MAG: hypothetical protein LBF37_03520 [Rickettsiales bacterium]|nr:hypothetical protein [Rickettsiales bacterium]
MGLKKEKIILFGKSYSTNQKIAGKLRRIGMQVYDIGYPEFYGNFYESSKHEIDAILKTVKPDKNIIILESGGLLRNPAYARFAEHSNIIDVELTTQGTYHKYLFPTINVARSNIKTTDEPEIIARCVFDMMQKRRLLDKARNYGVIGAGVIGKSIDDCLKANGYSVASYDVKDNDIDDKNKLLEWADCIIGATGRDCIDYSEIFNKVHTLVSVSSADIEFNNILKRVPPPRNMCNLFDDIQVQNIRIINGGFPITFDRKDSSKHKKILMTYGLWLTGLVQVGLAKEKEVGLVDLNNRYQSVVKEVYNKYAKVKIWNIF